jgi:hypothetical protein
MAGTAIADMIEGSAAAGGQFMTGFVADLAAWSQIAINAPGTSTDLGNLSEDLGAAQTDVGLCNGDGQMTSSTDQGLAEALQNPRSGALPGIHHPPLSGEGTCRIIYGADQDVVSSLTLGPIVPPVRAIPIVSVLNILAGEHKRARPTK